MSTRWSSASPTRSTASRDREPNAGVPHLAKGTYRCVAAVAWHRPQSPCCASSPSPPALTVSQAAAAPARALAAARHRREPRWPGRRRCSARPAAAPGRRSATAAGVAAAIAPVISSPAFGPQPRRPRHRPRVRARCSTPATPAPDSPRPRRRSWRHPSRRISGARADAPGSRTTVVAGPGARSIVLVGGGDPTLAAGRAACRRLPAAGHAARAGQAHGAGAESARPPQRAAWLRHLALHRSGARRPAGRLATSAPATCR